METALETLADSLEPFLGQRPLATNYSVTFCLYSKHASAHVEIFPDNIPCGSASSVDGVHIVQTFCGPKGEPFNLKRLLNDRYEKVMDYLHNAAFWGKLEFHALTENFVILVHDRYERVTRNDLEPDEETGVSELHCKVQLMISEWEYLNNLLYIIRRGRKTMEAEVELFVRNYEGEA